MSKKKKKEDKKEDVLKKDAASDKNLVEKELESWEKKLKFEDGLPQEY